MNALFRFERFRKGTIFIDGVDIEIIPIKDLRNKLCMIPQDPVMFAATVRVNLDPFNQYTDEMIWNVLDQAKLSETIHSLPMKLDEIVAEGGGNFSIGQRQLICFSRALLRRPKILLLDEATASVDHYIDNHMQILVRSTFADCTVLTIAHRLHTVRDCDRIAVLSDGVVAEFDSPDRLLATENGIFSSMWRQHEEISLIRKSVVQNSALSSATNTCSAAAAAHEEGLPSVL